MELNHPDVVKKIIHWQRELREFTGNKRVVILAYKSPPTTDKIDFADLVEIVCGVMGVEFNEVTGKCRKRELVVTRHLIAYFGSSLTTQTLTSIGQRIRKDHTTIMHGRRTIQDLLEIGDEVICTAVAKINQAIDQKSKTASA